MITDYGTNNIVIGTGDGAPIYHFDNNTTTINIRTAYDTDGRIYHYSPNYATYGSGGRTTFEELADALERAQLELTRYEDVADGRKHFYQVMDDAKHQRAEDIDTEQFNEYLDEWSGER